MQVFKAFLRILQKKLLTAMIWVVVFLIIAVGVTTNNSSPFSFTENQFNICVFDEDQTPESQALVAYLGQSIVGNPYSLTIPMVGMMVILYRSEMCHVVRKSYAEQSRSSKKKRR